MDKIKSAINKTKRFATAKNRKSPVRPKSGIENSHKHPPGVSRQHTWELTNRAYIFSLCYRYLGRCVALDYYYGTHKYRAGYQGITWIINRAVQRGEAKELNEDGYNLSCG